MQVALLTLNLIALLYVAYRLDLRDKINWVRKVSGEYSVNRRQKELLFELTPYAVVSTDLYGKVLMCNERFHKKFGYKESEMIGQNIQKIIPERYRHVHELGMQHFRDTGEAKLVNNDEGIELMALHKNGTEFPVHLKLISIKDGAFKTIGAFLRNITKEKDKEKILISNLALLNAGETCMEIASWHWQLLNNQSKIVDVTDNFYEVFNIDYGKAITADLLMQLVYPHDALETAMKINQAIENKQNYRTKYRRLMKDGSLRLIEVRGCLIFNEENEIIAISGTIQKLRDGVDGT